ncbi:lysoplasmalogenase [Shimia sp. NS0008-38b]|uniref:lysoplasmalogenase n=1 Tax=Shimia sp. NS0008-38b TaxID=3127653 RepID=UPI003105E776
MSIVEEIALRQGIRLGILIFGFIAGLAYAVFFCHRSASPLKTIVKLIPMSAFAVAVAISFGSGAVVLALVLSAFGDFALSRNGERAFLAGLVSFALAHIVYALFFWQRSDGALADPVILISLAVFALSTEFWLRPYTGRLKWPVRVYVVLISLMGATALGVSSNALVVTGALMFMASDTLLAMQLFRMAADAPQQRLVSIALWCLYFVGQFLIVSGVGWYTPLF